MSIAVHAGWAMSGRGRVDANARDALHRAIDEVHPASTQLRAGNVVPCLLDEIEQTNATLVAVGPRGHSRAGRDARQRRRPELLHRAPCSVLFARKPRFGAFR